MDRRRLILGIAALASLAAGRIGLNFVGTRQTAESQDGADAVRRLTSLFSDRNAAKEVGRRYLVLESNEADIAVLLAALPANEPDINMRTLRAAIQRRRERDFREGNVVLIDGWVMARTEARLCALAALV